MSSLRADRVENPCFELLNCALAHMRSLCANAQSKPFESRGIVMRLAEDNPALFRMRHDRRIESAGPPAEERRRVQWSRWFANADAGPFDSETPDGNAMHQRMLVPIGDSTTADPGSKEAILLAEATGGRAESLPALTGVESLVRDGFTPPLHEWVANAAMRWNADLKNRSSPVPQPALE